MKKKSNLFLAIGVIAVGLLIYFVVAASTKKEQNPATGTTSETVQSNSQPSSKEEANSKYTKLLVLREIKSEKSPHPDGKVVQLFIVNLKDNAEKLVFTDLDEDFQIRLVGGVLEDSVIIFGTQLNEVSGALWKIKLDGTGKKESFFGAFTPTSFSISSQKIVYTAYDNIQGVYTLWTADHDGRFKAKIYQSEQIVTDPVFVDDKILAFVSLNKKGEASIFTISSDGKNPQEILKAKGESIYSLCYASTHFAYVKAPVGAQSKEKAEIYTVNREGGEEKRIQSDKEADNFPIISPDGTLLAFAKNGKIWTGKVDGTELKSFSDGVRPLSFIK